MITIETRLSEIDTRLSRIDTRLNGIDSRLSAIDNRLSGIENNAKIQTSILRSMEKLIRQLCKHFANNGFESSSQKSNFTHSSTGTTIYKRRNEKKR